MTKRLLAIAFIAALVVSCSKKDDKSWQDTNTMLQEPDGTTTVVDSAALKAPVDQGAISAGTNADAAKTTAAVTDSAAAK